MIRSLLIAVVLVFAIIGGCSDPEALKPSERVLDLKVLPFELTDQDGKTTTQQVLDGKITIAAFIFTNCPFACPGMMAALSEVEGKLTGTGVQYLCISVDPKRDTTERLRTYRDRFASTPANWTMLTGDQQLVWSMIQDGLFFNIDEDDQTEITLDDGSTMLNIVHPTHFVLVGPTGLVLDIFRYSDDDELARLVERARAAAEAL